jgi:hypothetical protein
MLRTQAIKHPCAMKALFRKSILILVRIGLSAHTLKDPDRIPVITDADTANEVDDLFAVVRALLEPGFEVIGFCSAQWQGSQWATPNTMEHSQRLNDGFLGNTGKSLFRKLTLQLH